MSMRVRAPEDISAQIQMFECCKLNSLVKTLIIRSRWGLTLFHISGNSNDYCFCLNREIIAF